MTNEEILCTFMESLPEQGPFDFRPWRSVSPLGWWVAPKPLDPDNPALNAWQPLLTACLERERLGYLWEVEERLTDEQCRAYDALLDSQADYPRPENYTWHATPEQKIQALVVVIGPLVCHAEGEKHESA